ncbi:synaptobrevin-domain-containing protein [Neohortaea acidophila]|uniref:Synaptobrevin homolog YKT6 n=1 Tax=Neohortaea acidophila TaxID=245834 RepID=A0A6A6PS30_9PEZI|nr:synaptobrevin-domain-containing protein [Neohortaea acidophila]KAF2482910.1 synaptobrevin-domain-containing protein [Neohortaea acidophila]
MPEASARAALPCPAGQSKADAFHDTRRSGPLLNHDTCALAETARYFTTSPAFIEAQRYSEPTPSGPPPCPVAMAASASTPATPLLYSCIAHHDTILTEHTIASAAGVSNLASVILPKISHETAQKLIYTHNQHYIYYISDADGTSSSKASDLSGAGLTYLVVAKADLGRSIPFGFLLEVKKRFLKDYDAERTSFASLPAYGAAAFNTQLKQLMVDYGTTKSGQTSAFANVQADIDNVRGIMTENIERVLERGERIDLLVDKTDRLGGSARDFRVRSRGLRRKMWWKNTRLMVLLVVVIVFLVYLGIGIGCGLPGWGRCIGGGKS